ncbi:MAG TPA: pyridoxal-dependent decarboxylase [Gemmatimonadales bacterium]
MSSTVTGRETLTLDPTDWAPVRALAHQMLDDMIDQLESIGEIPAWRETPPEIAAAIAEPVPVKPQGLDRAYRDFRRVVLPYSTFNIHPRFWGWVMGTGSIEGMLAELLSAGLNLNAGGANVSGSLVELQVLQWCKSLMGFPASAGAVLVTGGSTANLVALAAARDASLGSLADAGVQVSGRHLVFYGSEETHNSVPKALRLLGMGQSGWRAVPTDAEFRIDVAQLERMIAEDRAAGYRPACVIGNAGTVNTGALDDLSALLAICRREGLWFHVDGAFGAIAALSPSLSSLVRGMEQADSLAFDLHKWLHIPYDAGCVLVRDREAHRRPFLQHGSYLTKMERGPGAMPVLFSDFGPELSRSFRGLKVWLAFKAHGTAIYGRLAEENVAQARYLAERVTAEPELELLAPVPLNIVCFRYRGLGGVPDDILNERNRQLLMRLQTDGIAVPSHTVLQGRFAIRVAITNHRSRRSDFDALVEAVLRIGKALQ